jgi:hypothetical protein
MSPDRPDTVASCSLIVARFSRPSCVPAIGKALP